MYEGQFTRLVFSHPFQHICNIFTHCVNFALTVPNDKTKFNLFADYKFNVPDTIISVFDGVKCMGKRENAGNQ